MKNRSQRAAAQAGDHQKEEARHEGGPKARDFRGLSYYTDAAAAGPEKPPSARKRRKNATDRQVACVGLSQIYAHTRFCLDHGLGLNRRNVALAIAVMLGAGGPPTSYWLGRGLGRGLGRRLVQWHG